MKTTNDTSGSNLSVYEVRAIGAFKQGDPVLADRVSEALTSGQMRAVHLQQITLRADMSRRHGGR